LGLKELEEAAAGGGGEAKPGGGSGENQFHDDLQC
jgi:hypothetical protein